jgi:hypothetical protein
MASAGLGAAIFDIRLCYSRGLSFGASKLDTIKGTAVQIGTEATPATTRTIRSLEGQIPLAGLYRLKTREMLRHYLRQTVKNTQESRSISVLMLQ